MIGHRTIKEIIANLTEILYVGQNESLGRWRARQKNIVLAGSLKSLN